jgi:hypothetical protein
MGSQMLFGLAPAILYSAALLRWWNRVMLPARRRSAKRIEMISEPLGIAKA